MLFAKIKRLPEANVVPALMLRMPSKLADTTELFDMPKLMPFEFEKTIVPLVPVCVPAAMPPGAVDWVAEKLAVIVAPFAPKLMLLLLLKTIALPVAFVVPADTDRT